MFSSIPFSRTILYAMLLFLIPIVFVGMNIFSNIHGVNQVGEKIEHVQLVALQQEKKQSSNITVINHFKEADHFYIDKNLEVLTFLEPEIDALQKIVHHKNFTDDEVIKKRLELLTGNGNALRFSEGVVQTHPQFQETTETLIHPVEVNLYDIQKMLALIEGIQIGNFMPGPNRPQLVILDFKIEKKKVIDKNEIFLLNMKLLKREFL